MMNYEVSEKKNNRWQLLQYQNGDLLDKVASTEDILVKYIELVVQMKYIMEWLMAESSQLNSFMHTEVNFPLCKDLSCIFHCTTPPRLSLHLLCVRLGEIYRVN